MKVKLILFIMSILVYSAFAGGQEEAAASAERGKYLAGQGIIIPPDEVHIDSYIASINYKYPNPEDELGVILYSGNYQVSTEGQEEVIHIGIQGRKQSFEELPPMNLAFVIDKSGSMEQRDKMGWVKDAFEIFIERVRDIDFVSLIVFDDQAQVLFPSTRMNSKDKRDEFKMAVISISSGGGTNLVAGLNLGYQQVLSNFRNEYTNRVLFLTDGIGESTGILDMAESYKELGINVSTIGVGTDFDLELMVNLSKKGGGSSRFISDREEMEETFGSELDRMVVPVARNLQMVLELPPEMEILGTWGYENHIMGNKILYFQSTLHHGDYETILANIRIPRQSSSGKKDLANFSITYDDLEGREHSLGPYTLSADFVDMESPVSGFSSGKVLHSGTMLHIARNLKKIGELYYTSEFLEGPLFDERMNEALNLTIATRNEVANARIRLDNEGFDDEIMILEKYIDIIGEDLQLGGGKVREIRANHEIIPAAPERSLEEHLHNLFREMALDLGREKSGVVAITGFTANDDRPSPFIDLLNQMAMREISRMDTFTVVDRDNINTIIEEQRLSLSGLMDTTTAIEIGNLLTADYMITGSVISMANSLVIFARILNVETAEVESVAQVIVPKKIVKDL